MLTIKKIDEVGEFEKFSSLSASAAVDTVGVGIGETVIVTSGSNSRFVFGDEKKAPIDTIIVGIVDEIQIV